MVSGPAFTSLTIDPSTNMAGFDASRISFTSSQIQVDWQNLPFNSGTLVKLNLVPGPPPVPVPPSIILSVTGILGVGLYSVIFATRRVRGPMYAGRHRR